MRIAQKTSSTINREYISVNPENIPDLDPEWWTGSEESLILLH
jgi:hypothetical protein